MAIIDGHVHVHRSGNPLPDHPLFEDRGWDATVEDLITVTEAHGVDGAVLVPVTPAEENLQYAVESADAHPGRFAVVGVHEHDNPQAVDNYIRWADEHGVQGVRCFELGGRDGDAVDSIGAYPLLRALAERGHNLWLYCKADAYKLSAAVADEFPDLNIVYNLLGLPWPGGVGGVVMDEHGRPTLPTSTVPSPHLDDLKAAGQRDNTYVMYGGHFQYSKEPHPHLDLKEHVGELYSAFGADHMLWITDWPWTDQVPGYAPLVSDIDLHLPQLSEQERAMVMGGTAERILRF